MKKNRFVKIISAVTVFTGLLFTSCHDNIYALIEKEVELDTSGLKGDISNIVRCNDYLFLANGNIYGKKAVTLEELGTHNWSGVNSPVSGKSEFNVSNRVVWLAADDTYLYALALFHDEDDNGANYDNMRAIYAAKVEADAETGFVTLEWEKVTEASDDKIKIIFDNKANSGRNAYATIGGKVYKLSGTSEPAEFSVSASAGNFIGSDSTKVMNCTNYKGSDYFSDYYAFASNDKYIYYAPTRTTGSANQADTYSRIYCTDGTSNADGTVKEAGFGRTSSGVLSLTLTSDYVFYGITSGLERFAIDEDGKLLERHSFSNNGGSVISEHVYMVYAFDETKTMDKTDLYCASVIYGSISSSSDSYDDIGLYACPAGDDWNRDGD